jgi:hypothetical protein
MCFALAAALSALGLVTSAAVITAVVVLLMLWLRTATAPGAALLAPLGGAVLITLANRDAQLPDQPTGTCGALTDETLG